MARCCLLRWLCWLACVASGGLAAAQSIPVQFTPLPSGSFSPTPNAAPGAAGAIPSGTFDPYAAPRLGTPSFGAASTPPTLNSWPSGGVSNGFGAPTTAYPGTTYPGAAVPGSATPWSNPAPSTPSSWWPNFGTTTPNVTPTVPATPTYPGYTYPQQSPSVVFPNGIYGPGSTLDPYIEPFRIFQHPRFSDTWLYGGDNPKDVGIHDLEFAVTGALPNFFATTQPLYITPTFMLHLWDGPAAIPADLPPNAYSAFLDFFWASDPNRPIGAELGVAVGAFTDFDTFNTHSIRVIGEGFGVVRLTETLTFKLGVWYLNRNDIKLLPAGGLVWQPNAQTKVDILFPNPKYSQYLTTIGTSDVWAYASGEYGGGAWTIQRTDGTSDRVDINDIRVKFGVDWINQRNWRGYFEVGYVFNRDVVYVVTPADSFRARDTFLLGGGFSF